VDGRRALGTARSRGAHQSVIIAVHRAPSHHRVPQFRRTTNLNRTGNAADWWLLISASSGIRREITANP
jgi:hypothetical protein